MGNRLRALTVVPLVAACLAQGCARLVTETSLTAEPLESPRRAKVSLPPRIAVAGTRVDKTVVSKVFDEARCGEELRQRVRGTRTTHVRVDGQSLVAEWLFGGALLLLGGAGTAYTATRTVDPQEIPGSQSNRLGLTAGVAGAGVALLGAALYQQLQLGTHREDIGERELRRVEREQGCGRTAKGGEQLRLTLSDGLQLHATSDAAGQAVFVLPDDLDERLEAGGSRRAVLEARSDASAQAVVPL